MSKSWTRRTPPIDTGDDSQYQMDSHSSMLFIRMMNDVLSLVIDSQEIAMQHKTFAAVRQYHIKLQVYMDQFSYVIPDEATRKVISKLEADLFKFMLYLEEDKERHNLKNILKYLAACRYLNKLGQAGLQKQQFFLRISETQPEGFEAIDKILEPAKKHDDGRNHDDGSV